MNRTPKQGEPYQLCTHLAAPRTGCHYWQVPGRESWLVLCDACHGSFSERKSVEIRGETFKLAEDIAIVPNSSCVHHSPPGDVIAEERPQPTQKAPHFPAGQVLKFRSKEQEAQAWLVIGEQLAAIVGKFADSFQKQAEARANIELRHKELEGQAMERMIRVLESNAATIEGMQATALASQTAMVETLKRLQSDLIARAAVRPAPEADSFLGQLDSVQRELRKPRRNGARRTPRPV